MLLRRLVRGAGHELRNAQNAATVNLEAARSRAAKENGNPGPIQPYLDNAARGLEDSVGIAEGTVALCAALLEAVIAGNLRLIGAGPNGHEQVELRMSADQAVRLVQSARALAVRTGVAVEPSEPGVILTIPHEHEAN